MPSLVTWLYSVGPYNRREASGAQRHTTLQEINKYLSSISTLLVDVLSDEAHFPVHKWLHFTVTLHGR